MSESKESNLIMFTDNTEENKEFNRVYQEQDDKTKQQIDQIQSLEIKIEILKNLANEKLMEFYHNLSPKRKSSLDLLPIRDKLLILRNLYKEAYLKGNIRTTFAQDLKMGLNEEYSYDLNKGPPEELMEPEELDESEKQSNLSKKEVPNQAQFANIVNIYFGLNPYISSSIGSYELEVKFGTRGIKHLTRTDYDNVIAKLKSLQFYDYEENTTQEGIYRLSIQNEYIDNRSGRFQLSDIRTEIHGLTFIQMYCKNDDISEITSKYPNAIAFVSKKNYKIDNKPVYPVNFDDFNFRVTLKKEENIKKSTEIYIKSNWKKNKKVFRLINRVSFVHPSYPIQVDISIVKNSGFGRNQKTFYTLAESDLFNKQEIYELEIEVINNKIGPGTEYKTSAQILEALRKVIKIVLSGLQSTNYPVAYPEQRGILSSYMKLLYKDNYKPEKRIRSGDFIGPSSITLQLGNVADLDENSSVPNIRKDFVVTEKADGTRHLMYIADKGRIYLIDTNMNVIFTGAKTENDNLFETLLDGELITNNKSGDYINLYAVFDIYYLKKEDVRSLTFMPYHYKEKAKDPNKCRYNLLKNVVNNLRPISIMEVSKEEKSVVSLKSMVSKSSDLISPIRIQYKKFYPEGANDNIFQACKNVLTKLYEYETDGLIFTHSYYGVGADKIGEKGPLNKITWEYSFKWKPPKYNTIDFLVTTVKSANGDDVVKPIFEDGTNNSLNTQFSEYKMIQLRCTFIPYKHGYINPCQDIIDDKLPEYTNYEDRNDKDAIPVQFYPTNPYDQNAGLTHIMLRTDGNGGKQMFTLENEVFTDNTIVEFSYDLDKEKGWRWIPLRVRYDKTSDLRQPGSTQFGNAYHVANSNWQSIHNPVTEDMISTGLDIPDFTVDADKYYNETSGKFRTQAMKDFHNLYVKKILIKSVSKQGDTLIDFACGKAGDLPKWISARLSFVFGIDKSKENLENKLNGACARYLNQRKMNKNMPYALFVNGNSSYNIKNGSAMLNDKATQITKAVFGVGPKDDDKIGKGVARQYGKGEDGFNVASCQFALHYFFENPDTLQGFMRNLAECTKLNGYFIGTAYDGKQVFNLLKKKQPGESIQIVEDEKKIWEVTKGYQAEEFVDNASSIGYKIDVFQESINQTFSEYLINFDYLDRVMENYGFKLIDREEAQNLGLPEGSGLFSEMFMSMLEEIKKNKFKEKDYGTACQMTSFEKKISFLNRYFVYKKVINVNTEKVQLELGEYTESEIKRNAMETKQSVEVAKKEMENLKPKIRKLTKKLLLEPATEAIDESREKPKDIVKKVKKNEKVNKPKLLIIEDDEN